jgi:hypothetical protein
MLVDCSCKCCWASMGLLLIMSRFDIFLPAEYPLTPPKMAFVLDGNDSDTYSFNPNLHVGGGGKFSSHIYDGSC